MNSQAVFIVGAPRSGTKLLRTLLNNHPDISLGGEGRFIPYLVEHFGMGADVSEPHLWPKIYDELSQTAYFSAQKDKGRSVTEAQFLEALEARTQQGGKVEWKDVLEVILRAYAPNPESRWFGDKSHSYISHIPLLRSIFGDVRFLFIVRDPRDQALSGFKTWQRNPLRTAIGWASVAEKAEKYGLDTAGDILAVRYEDLTADPESELARICTFLGVQMPSDMAELRGKVERRQPKGGGKSGVVHQEAKYKKGFSPKTIREISEITLPYLTKYGYPTEGATQHRVLSPSRLRWYKYTDGFSSLRFHVKDKGVVRGLAYYISQHAYQERLRHKARS